MCLSDLYGVANDPGRFAQLYEIFQSAADLNHDLGAQRATYHADLPKRSGIGRGKLVFDDTFMTDIADLNEHEDSERGSATGGEKLVKFSIFPMLYKVVFEDEVRQNYVFQVRIQAYLQLQSYYRNVVITKAKVTCIPP